MQAHIINAKSKLLSVIVYISDELTNLNDAIKSVINNIYKNIEIILVNNKCINNFDNIIEPLKDIKNIVIVEENNKLNLFQYIVTGFKHSHGDYIAFLDAKDRVTVDWYRTLIKRLEETESYFVIGDFNLEYEDEYRYFPNSVVRQTDIILKENEIKEQYFEQAGMDYSWHVIWNKIYTRLCWHSLFRKLIEKGCFLLQPLTLPMRIKNGNTPYFEEAI